MSIQDAALTISIFALAISIVGLLAAIAKSR